MNRISINRKRVTIDKDAVLLYIIMFMSGDTYLFGTNINENVLTAARVSLILVCVYIIYKMHFRIRLSGNKAKTMAYLTTAILFISVGIANGDTITRIGVKVLAMTIAFLLCMLFSFEKYAETFNKTMYFIAYTAVAFTVIAYIAPDLVRRLPYITNTANTKIYTCGFAGLLEGVLGQTMVRTQGIFWEPGVFQMYLNLAVAIELLYKKQINKKYITAYIIALFFSFSTTGYIVFAWIITAYVFIKRNAGREDVINRLVIIFLVFFAVVAVIQFTNIGDVVFGKMFDKGNVNFGSTTTRLAGIIVSTKIAFDNPVFGIGMVNMDSEFLRVALASRDILGGWTHDNTNTLFYQFAAHGIPFGVLFAVGTYKFGNCFANGRKIITISVFLMLFLLYIGENLQYSILPYIAVFYGYGWKESIASSNRVYTQGRQMSI